MGRRAVSVSLVWCAAGLMRGGAAQYVRWIRPGGTVADFLKDDTFKVGAGPIMTCACMLVCVAARSHENSRLSMNQLQATGGGGPCSVVADMYCAGSVASSNWPSLIGMKFNFCDGAYAMQIELT